MTTLTAPPVQMLDGERVLLQSRCRYLLTTRTGWGYNPISGALWLTHQRLVFKPDAAVGRMGGVILGASGARVVWFPLRRVVEASEQPMKVAWAWGKPNVLRLQFDNGGREYFELIKNAATPVGAQAATIIAAKVNADTLPYDAVPALKSGFEQPAGSGGRRMLLYWVLGVIALCIVCSVSALAFSALNK